MATDPRITDDRFQAEPPARPKSGRSTCLTGCLIALAVLVIVAVIAGVLVWTYRRELTAAIGAKVVKQGIEQSQLPAQEKQEVNEQVDRVADAYRSGKLTTEQVGEIMRKLADSPLMTSFVASALEAQYLAKSGLSDDEKAEGKRTLRRFLRGAIDKKIDEQAANAAMAHVADSKPDGNWELRKQLSDEELRKFLTAAKAEADKAAIPDEPDDFDPSDELKQILDEALEGKGNDAKQKAEKEN